MKYHPDKNPDAGDKVNSGERPRATVGVFIESQKFLMKGVCISECVWSVDTLRFSFL